MRTERKSVLLRYLTNLLTLSLVLFLTMPAFANDSALNSGSAHLYAYSHDDMAAQEDYATSNLGFFMYCYGHGHENADFLLGHGIVINDPEDYEKVLFPIWKDNEIVATFLVTTLEGGTCQGSYSEIYAEQLNAIKNIATQATPLSLVVLDDTFYAVISEQWYDLNGYPGEHITKTNGEAPSTAVIDAHDSLTYVEYQQVRIPTSYAVPYQLRFIQGSSKYCYAFALSNTLFNLGYTLSTPASIIEYMNRSEGAYMRDLAACLADNNKLSCTYSDNDYLIFSDVSRIIYQIKQPIIIGAHRVNTYYGHAFVIFGYADNSLIQTYSVWNPWYNYTQVVDASTRHIPTESTTDYIWDGGYLYNIRY